LGAVSLVTDVSSEMVTAVLPLYLVVGLGLSPLQFGFLDGLYSGVTALLRLFGGHAGDRWQRRKAVAGIGYSLSAASRIGLLVAGGSVAGLGAALAVDRAGKGLRTAPRDALIALSSAPGQLGRAFGVHRAMDTAGALLGPLVAFALLWVTVGAYDAVFVVSFCVGLLGVVLLVLFVRDRRQATGAAAAVSPRAALGLLRATQFRRLCLVAVVLGAVTIGDGFLYLLLRQRVGFAAQYFPLMPLGTAVIYLVLAVPLGRLADRIGRRRMFLAGHVALLGAYAALLWPVPAAGAVSGLGAVAMLAAVLVLHGLFYAATDGVLMAASASLLPPHLCGSGLAILQTGQAVARLSASILFGAAWTLWGGYPALAAAVAALVAALIVAARLMPDRDAVR
jgi:MFS family permease